MVHYFPYPDGCCQVINMVHLEYQFVHHGLVQYGIHDQVESFIVLDLFYIGESPCPEIVDNEYLVVQFQQSFSQMRPDKTRPARDQYLHKITP